MRIKSIDAFRAIAMFAVICIHTFKLPNGHYYMLQVVVDQLSRFAVPLFFIISGYFYGCGIHSGKTDASKGAIKLLKRITPLYFFWFIVYFLIPGANVLKNLLENKDSSIIAYYFHYRPILTRFEGIIP